MTSVESSIEVRTLIMLCEDVDTPRSLAVALLVKNQNWSELRSLPDPVYTGRILGGSPWHYGLDLQVSSFLKKHPSVGAVDAQTRSDLAFEKWLEAENQCRETNKKLRRYFRGEEFFPPGMEDVLTKAQSYIADVLGSVHDALPSILLNARFGPGANLSVRGARVSHANKYFPYQGSIGSALYPFLSAFRWETTSTVAVTDYNELTFVKKTSQIDRPITIEPHWNSYIQLGIGYGIRRALKKAGLDLDVQADVNRDRAREAFSKGYATIDLASASDTLSYELVSLLLPPDWFHLLDIARSPVTRFGDRSFTLEKFSGMGNGYTFELETLIFASLCYAVGEKKPCVFGDDIIVHQDRGYPLVEVLTVLGFTVNEAKSYLAGMFFESCGADFMEGFPVRPIYCKEISSSQQRLDLANLLRRRSASAGVYGCDSVFRRAWSFLAKPFLDTIGTLDGRCYGLMQPLPSGRRLCSYIVQPSKAPVSSMGAYLWALDKGSIGVFSRTSDFLVVTRWSATKMKLRRRSYRWSSTDSFVDPWV